MQMTNKIRMPEVVKSQSKSTKSQFRAFSVVDDFLYDIVFYSDVE